MRERNEMHFQFDCARRKLCAACAVAGVMLAVCLSLLRPAAAQKQETGNATVMQRSQFQASATLQDKSGKSKMVQAATHQWIILGEQRIPELPENGFLLVQLLGGNVTTTIDGKEQKRKKGEFWVVPANEKMSIHSKGETATLEVTVLSVS